MATGGVGDTGFVGLARRTRQALSLPEFLPAPRMDVARHACRLLSDDWEAACRDERLVDFVVGVVEAVDDLVATIAVGAELPLNLVERAEAEAASWLVDFLADGGGAPDRELLRELSSTMLSGEPDIDAMLFVLARKLSRALCSSMVTRVGPVGPAT
jgi:hypothetical protein